MMKNPKPTLLTLYIALSIATTVALIVFVLDRNIKNSAIVFLATGPVAYFFIYNALQTFIYRKIKLIYKSIHNLKLGKDNAFGEHLSDDPVNDVEQEVEEWARTKRKEIDDLKRMEQFRKEFLANVSHELKTPLFSLQGYIHTLIDGADEDPEIRKKFLEKSADNIERLCNLVDDLSEISQLERGEVSVAKETFDINQLVKEVFDSLEPQTTEKQISFSIKKGCDHSFLVLADRERIRQVLTNLLVNSVKYGRTHGETTVGFYDMDENILTEVSDNGIGIDEEHLPRLFERFYRVDKHRSRDAGGTGLGLAIVKHLIESQGGVINVRSTTGIGSTFGFTLRKSKEK